MFSDTLAASAGRWDERRGTGCDLRFGDGWYYIRVKGFYTCTSTTNFEAALTSLNDVRVEVDAELTEVPSAQSTPGPEVVSLWCRKSGLPDRLSGYSAGVGPGGYYTLDRHDGGAQANLKFGTTGLVSVVARRPFSLRLDCVGGETITLKFYVDGQLVASLVEQAGGHPKGAVGFDVASFTPISSPLEARFRNLRVFVSK